MKRVIKFRIFNGERMIYLKNNHLVAPEDSCFGRNEYMQFTGLTDINGKEIYEGDILKYAFDWDYENGYELENRIFKKPTKKHAGYFIGTVDWEGDEHAHFVINPTRLNLSPCSKLIKIIGNIYETPELVNNSDMLTTGAIATKS